MGQKAGSGKNISPTILYLLGYVMDSEFAVSIDATKIAVGDKNMKNS